MKMYIARDFEGLLAFYEMPHRYYLNPFNEADFIWVSESPDPNSSIQLPDNSFPDITIENSPKIKELEWVEPYK